MNYAKFLIAIAITIASSVSVAMTGDGVISNVEWINIAIAAAGALAVFAGPNVPGAMYTKSILAALTAGLTLATSLITDGITFSEWVQIGIAAIGALSVYAVPNKTTEVMSATR